MLPCLASSLATVVRKEDENSFKVELTVTKSSDMP